MTNEPEWVERFDKRFGGLAKLGTHAKGFDILDGPMNEVLKDVKSFIQDTINEEKEKSFREGQLSDDAHILCRKHEIEDIEKAKAELLSKIEEEVGATFCKSPLMKRKDKDGDAFYLDVINILSKYKTL